VHLNVLILLHFIFYGLIAQRARSWPTRGEHGVNKVLPARGNLTSLPRANDVSSWSSRHVPKTRGQHSGDRVAIPPFKITFDAAREKCSRWHILVITAVLKHEIRSQNKMSLRVWWWNQQDTWRWRNCSTNSPRVLQVSILQSVHVILRSPSNLW